MSKGSLASCVGNKAGGEAQHCDKDQRTSNYTFSDHVEAQEMRLDSSSNERTNSCGDCHRESAPKNDPYSWADDCSAARLCSHNPEQSQEDERPY
jgi:hypothetical protein